MSGSVHISTSIIFNNTSTIHGTPTPIEMLSMTKKPIVCSLSVSSSILREQRFFVAFVNNMDDQGPRPPRFNFFQPI